ncbi:MAG: hypothetical protein ACAH89_00910 [Rariglobus sp.]|nr:hypothetical protein [Rariglobus sp.]
MKKLIFSLVAFLIALPASAQPDAAQIRTFRLTATGGVYTDLFYDVKGNKTAVFAGMKGLSTPYACPTGGTLSFYREVPPPPDSPPNTKPTKQVVAEVTLPVAYKQSIVVLAPAPTPAPTPVPAAADAPAPLPIIGVAIEELPKEHTIGTFRVINLSTHPVAFALGDNVVPLAPQASSIVPFSPGPTDVKVAVRVGNPWRRVHYSERRLDANLRAYCVVIDSKSDDEFTPPAQALLLLDYVRTPAPR